MSKNKFNRDDDGLLQNVDYIYDEDGFVNWRKMIKSDYLVPNKIEPHKQMSPIKRSSSFNFIAGH